MYYTHLKPDEEISGFAGAYRVDAEKLLDYGGRKVLYLLESTTPLVTCSEGACRYADPISFICVPGFVKDWQCRMSHDGALLTNIEPVTDAGAKAEIERILIAAHGIGNVDFW